MAVSGKKALDMESTISMAVSGKKALDMETTICIGSVEDFEYICERCLSESLLVEAAKYCVECKEHLCKTCIQVHLKRKVSKPHKMIENDNLGTDVDAPSGSRVLTEKCPIHSGECIKYFCNSHEKLACSDCVKLNHRKCKIHYIPYICNGNEIKEEFVKTMVQIECKEAEYDEIVKKATERDKDVEIQYENDMKDIAKFQKEVDIKINQLKKDFEAEAIANKSKDKEEVQEVTNAYTKLSADMKEYQTRLNCLNASHENINLFIAMKQAKLRLKSERVIEAEKSLKLSETDSSFDLQSFLKRKNVYEIVTCLDIEKKTLKSLTIKDNISLTANISSGVWKTRITGSAVLSSNKLVLADQGHKMLIIVDIKTKHFLDRRQLECERYDIATLPDEQIAVTMPAKKQILLQEIRNEAAIAKAIMSMFFTRVSLIDVKRECKGICHEKGHLYVICKDPNCVLVMDTHGVEKSTISLNNQIFKEPTYIVINKISGLIYVSDFRSKCIASLTSQGHVYAMYKSFISQGRMVMLEDGSLLVSYGIDQIIHISEDLKHGVEITDDLKDEEKSWLGIKSICYNQEQQEIYVSYFSNGKIYVDILQPLWQTTFSKSLE